MKLKKINISKIKKHSHKIKLPLSNIRNFINRNEVSKKTFNDIKNIVLMLFSVFLFLIIWVNRVKLYPENVLIWLKDKACSTMASGEGFPCEIEGEKISVENFKMSNNNIIALSDNSLSIINCFGKVVRKEKHNFSNPCLKSGDMRNIIYDRGGKNFKIESLSQNLYSGKCEKNIIACAVSDSGTFAIVHQSASHLAETRIYNKKGKEKYSFSFSENYISDITLNSIGTEAAVCGMAAENGNISSSVYILDFNSSEPKFQFELKDNALTRVEYLSDGNVLAIGDKYMSFINLKSKNITNYSYGNKILKFCDFNKNEGICCCFSSSINESGNDEIIMVGITGKEVFKIQTTETLSGISHRGSKTAVITPHKIILYNFSGKAEGFVRTKNHAKKIILLPHSHACLLGAGKADKVKLSHLEKITN